MRCTALLVTLAVSSLVQATTADLIKRQAPSPPPSMCNGLDCPPDELQNLQIMGANAASAVPLASEPGVETNQILDPAAQAGQGQFSPSHSTPELETSQQGAEGGDTPSMNAQKANPSEANDEDNEIKGSGKSESGKDKKKDDDDDDDDDGDKGGNGVATPKGCNNAKTVQGYLRKCVKLAKAAKEASEKPELVKFFFGATAKHDKNASTVIKARYDEVIKQCSGKGHLKFSCANTEGMDCGRGPAMVKQCDDPNTVNLCEAEIARGAGGGQGQGQMPTAGPVSMPQGGKNLHANTNPYAPGAGRYGEGGAMKPGMGNGMGNGMSPIMSGGGASGYGAIPLMAGSLYPREEETLAPAQKSSGTGTGAGASAECQGKFNPGALLIHEISHALWGTWDEPGYGLATVKEQGKKKQGEFLADAWQYFAQAAGSDCQASVLSEAAQGQTKEPNKESDVGKLQGLRQCQAQQAQGLPTVVEGAQHPASGGYAKNHKNYLPNN